MSLKDLWRVGELKAHSVSYCAALMALVLFPFYAQARPCVEGVCLGDSIHAVEEFRYETVESFGRQLSPRKKRELDATYPRYPAELAMPLLQGRFDNKILMMLPAVNKACSPRSMIGKTLESAGVQTQFTLQLDTAGSWKVVGIAQIFPSLTRDELSRLAVELDKKYGKYSIHSANKAPHYTYVFNPNLAQPYFVLAQPMPDKKMMEKYRRSCA
ncbi:hypothetical protein [Pseudomonas mangrovi]|uniref:hypothetical protein n=1 Tax=Pseudomonas mangrovi TaxID=2161748 RepID=UPI0011B1FC7A|nr:hypothetical protein [Pseudomonas mangrovi]